MVAVPKLGELRQLPQAEQSESASTRQTTRSTGSNIGFVLLSLLAAGGLLAASYSTIRWAVIDVPTTTEVHLQEIEKFFDTAEPAMMIREFDDMESKSLELLGPYNYQRVVLEKSSWGRNALIACAVTLVGLLGAFILGTRSGKQDT